MATSPRKINKEPLQSHRSEPEPTFIAKDNTLGQESLGIATNVADSLIEFVGDHIRDVRLNSLIKPVAAQAAIQEQLLMLGMKTLRADPCIDDEIIEEEQAPMPPADPRATIIPPWMTGQVSGCNDFQPPSRDAAATLESATVKEAPVVIDRSTLDEDYHPAKSQKSVNSYMRKSTIMKRSSKHGVTSPQHSASDLKTTTENSKQKTSKFNQEDKQLLPGNIALELKDKDEGNWLAKMQVEQLRARIKRKEENQENNLKAYSSPKSEDTSNNKKKEKGDAFERNITFDD